MKTKLSQEKYWILWEKDVRELQLNGRNIYSFSQTVLRLKELFEISYDNISKQENILF